jgi:hypothetical protein
MKVAITQNDIFKLNKSESSILSELTFIPLVIMSDNLFIQSSNPDICDWQSLQIIKIPSTWTIIDLKVKIH